MVHNGKYRHRACDHCYWACDHCKHINQFKKKTKKAFLQSAYHVQNTVFHQKYFFSFKDFIRVKKLKWKKTARNNVPVVMRNEILVDLLDFKVSIKSFIVSIKGKYHYDCDLIY